MGPVFNRRQSAADALASAGITPLVLQEKEGLALINGTDGMLGMLILALSGPEESSAHIRPGDGDDVGGLLGTDKVYSEQLRPTPSPRAGTVRRPTSGDC